MQPLALGSWACKMLLSVQVNSWPILQLQPHFSSNQSLCTARSACPQWDIAGENSGLLVLFLALVLRFSRTGPHQQTVDLLNAVLEALICLEYRTFFFLFVCPFIYHLMYLLDLRTNQLLQIFKCFHLINLFLCMPLIQPPVCACVCLVLAVHFWTSTGTWVNWSTDLWLTSEHKDHPKRAQRRVEQCCPAARTSLSITRSAWCSAPNWALENQWLPSQLSSRNS